MNMPCNGLAPLRSCSIAALLAIFVLAGPSYAQQGEEAGFAGATSPAPDAPTGVVTFDDREQFVPPSSLAIQDSYVKEALSVSEGEARSQLTAVSVTPDGRIEYLPPGDATVEALMGAVESMNLLAPERDGANEPGSEGAPPDQQGANEDAAAFAQPSVSAESVIGVDTRVQVTNTTAVPYRMVGRIDLGCSGTLIGPRHVLTAGHCVYNINNDQWYSQLAFSPGQNGAVRPWGKIGWARAVSVQGWTRDHKRDFDYAMIVLNQDIGNQLGWMGYGWKNPMPNYNVNINGYPGDKASGTMWHAFCGLQTIQTYRLYYACDTYGGMSGSGVYVYFSNENKRTIYGIHAYGVDSTGLNGATRITQSVFDNLKSWKAKY